MPGALLTSASLFTSLPAGVLDASAGLALGGGVSLLRAGDLPKPLLGLAALRFGAGLAMVRAALAGDGPGELALSLGAALPGIAGPVLVGAGALALGGVLARATSRAAEVSARFSLDALPGAQAALEAELRGKSGPSASESRRALVEEARARGAADGVSRLVAADALLAPLFGGAVALGAGLSAGVGVALSLLGTALPPAFALAWSLQSPARSALSPSRWAALAPLALCLVGAPLLPMVVAALVLAWSTPPAPKPAALRALTPAGTPPEAALAAALARFPIPHPERIAPGTHDAPFAALHDEHGEIARGATLTEALRAALPRLLSTEEADAFLAQLGRRYPAALQHASAPAPVVAELLRILLEEGAPLDEAALAEGLASAPADASAVALAERVRQRLRPRLLARLGAAPVPVARLGGEAEDALSAPKPPPGWMEGALRAEAERLAASNPARPLVALCAREARRGLAAWLPEGWLVLSPEELPPTLEIDFLGELNPQEPD